MTITLSALQKQRRDTASNWTSNNPTLLAGEWGIESDTKKFKIGDGSAAWQSLEYVPIPDTNRLLEGNLTVGGNFTVNGTTTTIDTTTLTVEDKNIEIGKVSTPSDTTADGGGITLKGATDKTINWVDSTDSWTFSEHIDLASGKVLKSAGTQFLSSTQYTGNSATTTALATARTIGGVSFDGTGNIDLPGVNSVGNQNTTGSAATLTTPRTIAGVSFDGSANISLNNNAITNGAGYIDGSSLNASNLSSGTVPDSRFPATLPTISGVNLTSLNASNLASGTVSDARLPSSISSDITGNAATATALATARTIAGVSFDGTANISLNNNAITNGAGYITATLTNEEVQDIVGAMLTGNTETGITVTYQDSDGTIDFVVASQTDENFTTTLKNKLDGIAASAIDGSSLNASNLSSGTIPDARFPATLPAISGANLTNLPSGSDATKMPLAGGTFTGDVIFSGAGANITFDQSTDDFVFDDGAKAVFGTGLDLQIYHDSSTNNSHIKEAGSGCLVLNTDCFRVKNAAHTEDLIAADENGNVQLYYDNSKKFETTSTGATVTGALTTTGNINVPSANSVVTGSVVTTGSTALTAVDNGVAYFGTDLDLRISHTGSFGKIQNNTGDLNLYADTNVGIYNAAGTEVKAVFATNGSVDLYYDNVKKFSTTANGVEAGQFKGTNTFSAAFVCSDDGKAVFGDSEDLKLYHNGTHNYIDTLSNKLHIRVANGENAIVANSNGAVELYDNATKRLETVDDGVQVIGNLGINRDGAIAYGSTSTILEAVASDASNSIFESATFRGGADHNGAGARVRVVQGTHRGLVLEGGRESNAAFGRISLSDQNGGLTTSVHINSSGTWFWGKTSQSSGTAGVELYKDGPNFITRNDVNALGINCQSNSSGDSMRFYFQDTHRGSLNWNGSNFDAVNASDYRLKENDTPISDAINRVKKLRPIKFAWKTDPKTLYDGFFAHEVQEIVPQAVIGKKDAPINEKGEGYQMMSNAPLIPLLTAALKECISEIENLKQKYEQLV